MPIYGKYSMNYCSTHHNTGLVFHLNLGQTHLMITAHKNRSS